jgi:hypothetical protein
MPVATGLAIQPVFIVALGTAKDGGGSGQFTTLN